MLVIKGPVVTPKNGPKPAMTSATTVKYLVPIPLPPASVDGGAKKRDAGGILVIEE